ncbi:5-formyltetrahydrofolate cyclo-ligase [Nonlabens ulvanivorans]|nr:5-formyltetrahydrofolate cyclo-ligase [Nonlabens ulvanivorans]
MDLTLQEIEDNSLQIANRLLELDIWDYKMYHLFLSIEKHKEVQTDFLLHVLQGKNKNVVISKSNFTDYSMSHFLLTDDTRIVINKWGNSRA